MRLRMVRSMNGSVWEVSSLDGNGIGELDGIADNNEALSHSWFILSHMCYRRLYRISRQLVDNTSDFADRHNARYITPSSIVNN